MFHRYVASVFISMLKKIDRYVAYVAMVFQVYILHVSSIFRYMLQVFYLGVAYTYMLQAYVSSISVVSYYVTSVSSRYCIYFAMANMCFPGVSERMLQVFQLFLTYLANILIKCCKSRSCVTHVTVRPICRSHLLQLLGPRACTWKRRGHERQAWETERV
jgi:hypothetical protein